jgi:hypothetical protein
LACPNEASAEVYICGAEVRFEDPTPQHTTPVSIDYLSLDLFSVSAMSLHWLDFVMEARRLRCDQRYRERLRQLNKLFSRAA